MKYKNIEILEVRNNTIITKGLNDIIGYDVRLKNFENEKGAYNLIFFLIDYFIDKQPIIKNNETISYGLWLLKFYLQEHFFVIHELDELFADWNEGANNAIYYFEIQMQTCKMENAEFDMPLFTQNIAISNGVLDGKNVQGIRYKEPQHMSGWYLTTDEYDNNINHMKVIGLQNLVVNRKDLLQFLALPPGFVFETLENNQCHIWQMPKIVENLHGN